MHQLQRREPRLKYKYAHFNLPLGSGGSEPRGV
jgi:hypothetical protein